MKSPSPDPYLVLGVSRSATLEEIKVQYKKLIVIHHPDKGGDTDKAKEINSAYETLSDPDKRKAYDAPPQQHFHQNPFGFNFGGGIDINELFNQHFRRPPTYSAKLSIPLITALTGGKVELQTQLGVFAFDLPPGTQHQSQYQVRVQKDGHQMIIINCIIDIVIPTLTAAQLDQLKTIFPN